MRVVFKKGIQRKAIRLYKESYGLTWKTCSEQLGVREGTLRNWYYEQANVPEEIYKKIDSKKAFEKFVKTVVHDDWGRIKGGFSSKGTLKRIRVPRQNEALAECIGILLGDGNIWVKRSSYSVRIAGHAEQDREYLEEHVTTLFEELFHITPRTSFSKRSKGMYLRIDSKELVQFLALQGLLAGSKKDNGARIPRWIFAEKEFLSAAIRGLFDTDGSIHRMSRRDKERVRISFTSYYPALMKDVREGLQLLGYHPSKVIAGRNTSISRQEEVARYLKEIRFSNKKHLIRAQKFSPVV